MDYQLDAYLLKLDRDYEIDQCTCFAWIGEDPNCPVHGEEACWTEHERLEAEYEYK